MNGFQRKKWLGIAQRYRTMSADEQIRVQYRMTDWAKLTPDERKRARDNYQSMQKAPPDKKETVKQKWQEYEGLPENEKTRLNAEAARRPTPRPHPSKQAVAPTPPVKSTVPPSISPVGQAAAR
jgi:hypothetical protein